MSNALRFVLAAVVISVAPLAHAQEDAAPPTTPDPMIQSINDALDADTDTLDRPDSVFDRGEGAGRGALIQGIVALCIVLALLLLTYYALKRWGKGVPVLAGSHLAKVLGRIYLDRGTALHFVRVGDRVLVVGVTSNAISKVADFSASTFEDAAAGSDSAEPEFNPDSFLAELQEHSRDLKQAATLPRAEEDEIAALRGDIQRLQRYLRDENREQGE